MGLGLGNDQDLPIMYSDCLVKTIFGVGGPSFFLSTLGVGVGIEELRLRALGQTLEKASGCYIRRTTHPVLVA